MDKIKKNKKNIIVVLIVVIVVIVFLLLANYLYLFKGHTYEVGYKDIEENGFIISDYDTFISKMKYSDEDLVEKYDRDFFEKKSLAVVYIETGTSTNLVMYRYSIVEGDTITINYKERAISSDCAMNGYYIVVEVNKDVKKIEGYN